MMVMIWSVRQCLTCTESLALHNASLPCDILQLYSSRGASACTHKDCYSNAQLYTPIRSFSSVYNADIFIIHSGKSKWNDVCAWHFPPPPHYFNTESKLRPQSYILQRVTSFHKECHLLAATVLWFALWNFWQNNAFVSRTNLQGYSNWPSFW